jgi:hypothetical protein
MLMPLAVVTEDIELAVHEATVRPGEVGKSPLLSDLLDVGGRTFGEGLCLLGSSRDRSDREARQREDSKRRREGG